MSTAEEAARAALAETPEGRELLAEVDAVITLTDQQLLDLYSSGADVSDVQALVMLAELQDRGLLCVECGGTPEAAHSHTGSVP